MNDKVTMDESRMRGGEDHLLAALTQAREVSYRFAEAGVSTPEGEGFAYVVPTAWLSREEEIATARAEAADMMAKINALSGEERAAIPGDLIAQIQKASQTGNLKGVNVGAIDKAIEEAKETARTERQHELHVQAEKEAEAKLLWHEIREIDDDIDTRMKKMLQGGLITQAQYDSYAQAKREAQEHPGSKAAQDKLAEVTDANLDDADKKATKPEDKTLVGSTRGLTVRRKEKTQKMYEALPDADDLEAALMADARSTKTQENVSHAKDVSHDHMGSLVPTAIAAAKGTSSQNARG